MIMYLVCVTFQLQTGGRCELAAHPPPEQAVFSRRNSLADFLFLRPLSSLSPCLLIPLAPSGFWSWVSFLGSFEWYVCRCSVGLSGDFSISFSLSFLARCLYFLLLARGVFFPQP